ncbi:hypothetical protein TIFTF001_013917 [Ficus carica]|uniref:Uncharacterized protein n=1 Tax=Ficus carica TaxID=3494 RepID=A0AA88D7Q1_FICCA|nr:hypothetical protein TIFTF001_013917 [Ficus carica]
MGVRVSGERGRLGGLSGVGNMARQQRNSGDKGIFSGGGGSKPERERGGRRYLKFFRAECWREGEGENWRRKGRE